MDLIRLDKIKNFYQITENIATAGQPAEEQFSIIYEAGYTVVINLASHNSKNSLSDEGALVAGFGMTYVNIPVSWNSPAISHLKSFLNIMEVFKDEKVFVHCVANYRVSVFIYHYLTLKKGFSPDRAVSPILKEWKPKMGSEWRNMFELKEDDFENTGNFIVDDKAIVY